MTNMDINLGYWLNKSISDIAGAKKQTFSLVHCNLITAICRAQGVPNVEDESPWLPFQPITFSYFQDLDNGPVEVPVNEDEHHEPMAHQGAVDVEEDVEMMAEYNQFEHGEHPQQHQSPHHQPHHEPQP
ncbi:hypothetical protein A2U01_0023904 [Trifolium medium]|uniref:Uncharacterized protein n=1 Tax=Trifolium medium TaxID=97028 RepID=A0A392NUH8_9FABA|nr:hypothetical protein [Trifolium medium]